MCSKKGELRVVGAPSLMELKGTPGFPKEEDMKRGPIAFIECVEEIPCNPCEAVCPTHAISIGEPITSLPALNADKCRGCGLCIAACPGLAIYVKDYTFEENRALISFPFEFLPLPEVGQRVWMVNRLGESLCSGEIIKVDNRKAYNRTPVISAVFDKAFFLEVVSMRRL